MSSRPSVYTGFKWVMVFEFISLAVASLLLVWFARPFTLNDLGIISRYTTLSFPKTSVLVDGAMKETWGWYIIAKVSIPQQDLKGFLRQSLLVDVKLRAEDWLASHDVSPMKKRGWNPSAARTFLVAGALPVDETSFLWLMLDLDDPQQAVVYVWLYH